MASLKSLMSNIFDSGSSSSRNFKTRYLSLTDGLQVNTKILIDGHVNPAASKYEFNLWCGSIVSDELIKSGNIALHLMVNPSAGYALLNSRTGKHWGNEERTSRGRLPPPLLQNQHFQICIEVERNQYRIDVNSNQFVTFLHRHPFESVGLLSYEGDFNVDNIQIQPYVPPANLDQLYPLGQLADNGDNSANNHILYDVKFPHLPMLLPIKAGLTVGMLIEIDGQINGNRFDISLYQGSNPYGDPNSDVAFHMEVYMREMIIVRNSNQNNEWLEPEKELTHFPFMGQGVFNLKIRVEPNRYHVSVGGRYIFDFYHRVTLLSSVDHLCIHGSVNLSSLMISLPPL